MNPQHKFQRRDSGDWPVCEVCDLPFTAYVHGTEPTTPELSTEEAAVVQRFEAAADAEESFDATAALRRVMDFAKAYERGDIGDPGRAVVAWMIRVAVHDSCIVRGES